jgi:hypothetical protein
MRKAFALLLVLGLFAFVSSALAQSQNDSKAAPNPLVKLLESKGILTPAEAAMVSKASSPAEANQKLAKLLLSKGLITQQEYNQTVQAYSVSTTPAATVTPTAAAPATGQVVPAVLHPTKSSNANSNSHGLTVAKITDIADILPGGDRSGGGLAFGTIEPSPAVPSPEPAAGPDVVPAFAPIRVLPVGLMGYDSVKPIIGMGPIHIQPYGYLRMNIIEDSSNPFGGDAPLSGMLVSNTGPNTSPTFNLNARNTRVGSNFEWLDPNHKLVVTGKLEFDFEGNYTNVFNRNISSIRSSMPSLRLAFGRIDYHMSDHGGVFALFGQDWTPFCSSTLPSSTEYTLLGVEFGSCYERDMQARFGFNYEFGGSRHFQIQPEFALAYPGIGNATAAETAGSANTSERSGGDSNRPEYQGRVVFQFQLDKAPKVPPAEFIVSGMYGKAKLNVASTAVPGPFKSDFPGGASTGFKTWGMSAEAQMPTRWFTLEGKWWAGQALRFYFVDNLLTSFNPTGSFLAANPGGVVETASSISGEGTAVAFGCTVALVSDACPAGDGVVLPQEGVRGVGGFGDLGIPLSRLFHANPAGRNAGWTLNLLYSVDQSTVRDLRQVTSAGIRYKNDWGAVTLNYKLNSWVLIGFEEGYYRTRALPATCAPDCSTAGNPFGYPLVINGLGVHSWHDLHEEISTIFFF